jgi:hypothetical protein
MTIHPHVQVPQPPSPPKPRSVGMPLMLLALASMVAIGYAAFLYLPVGDFGSAPLTTTGQGGPVAIAPIRELAAPN